MKNKVFAFTNAKGGVGKSCTTVSLGAGLALNNKRVLLIDLDAQQHLTFSLTQKEFDKGIYDSLIRNEPLNIVNVRENLDIIPATIELARVEIDLASKMAREGILRKLLEPIKDNYDVILIDCPPNLGIVTTNALVASDKILIPLTAEALPLKGLKMIDDIVDEVKSLVNPTLEIGGIVITRFNQRRNLNRDVLQLIKERYEDKVFQTKIRENILLAEAPLFGQTIYEYEPKSNGAKDYMAMTKEFIERFYTQNLFS